MWEVFFIYLIILDDGLASKLRFRLRKCCPKSLEELEVVYSSESPVISLLPLDKKSKV